MSFKANGTQVNYKTIGAIVATFSNNSSEYLGAFSGYDATSNMNLQVYDGATITTKNYSGYTAAGNGLIGVLIGYQGDSGTLCSEAGDDAPATVTSISETSVSGTFSGTIKADRKADIAITNGKFTLQRFN